MVLSNLQERIERSIFEAIRIITVLSGYYPDEPTFNNQDDFQAAVLAIKQSKGFAVEVFGVGSSQAKGTKKTPRITLVTNRSMPGETGRGDVLEFTETDDPDILEMSVTTGAASNLHIDVILTSSSAAQDRVINAIVLKALGTLRYIPLFDVEDSKEYFLVKQYNYYDTPDPPEGITEKTYAYQVLDLFLEDNLPLGTVVPIKEIELDIEDYDETTLEIIKVGSTVEDGLIVNGRYLIINGNPLIVNSLNVP